MLPLVSFFHPLEAPLGPRLGATKKRVKSSIYRNLSFNIRDSSGSCQTIIPSEQLQHSAHDPSLATKTRKEEAAP